MADDVALLEASMKLGQVRDLHKPEDTGVTRTFGGGRRAAVVVCPACLAYQDNMGDDVMTDWPCDTARIVYTDDEIREKMA